MTAREGLEGGESDREAAAWSIPGAVIGGRYVVEGTLGSGGMGWVVRARHRDLGELRAIKFLRPDRRLAPNAQRRLLREARATARIQSDHVVRVMDVASDGPGAPYIVMEYLEGETLAARLRRGPLTPNLAARMIIETCDGLAEAHRAGTVHRDLKPSNLFLLTAGQRQDFVKVLDFGIAKTEEPGNDWTHSQALLASPAYASPEQLRASKDVDTRTDLWSLGVILYQCLTGKVPFEGATLAVLSTRVLRDAYVPLRKRGVTVPQKLEHIVERCLDKSPDARFANVDALVEALAPFAPETAAECLARLRTLGPARQVTTTTRSREHLDLGGDGTVTHPSFDGREARRKDVGGLGRRPPKPVLAVAAVLLVAATATFFIGRSPVGQAEAEPGTAAPRTTASPAAMVTSVPAAPIRPVAVPAPAQVADPLADLPPARLDPRPPSGPSSRQSNDRMRAEAARRDPPPATTSAAQPAPRGLASPGTTGVVPIERLPLDQLIDGRN